MDFLQKKRATEIPPVVAIAGEVVFLRREAMLVVRDAVLGDEPSDFNYSVHAGEAIVAREVFDDLWTPPMIGARRFVAVQDADGFVSDNRPALEKYAENPSTCAVLLLDLRTFPATTRLYKAVRQSGLVIECAKPKDHLVASWCRQWAKWRYGQALPKDAADWLVELVGTEFGVLDQELCKLSTFVGDAGAIGYEVVTRLSAGGGVDKAFAILEVALDGNAAQALALLERQLAAGDAPQRLLNIVISQMRKLTKAARMAVAQTHSLPQALALAGVPPFAIDKTASRLRRLGRDRMVPMYRRLLAADLAVKGDSGLDECAVLTRLVLELAEGAAHPAPPRSA